MADNISIKGWCPGAWRPMPSGDGLLVRVRPERAMLDRNQVLALCEASETFGNGIIHLTNRANLQLRGVKEKHWRPLLDMLMGAGLVDSDPAREGQRNLLLAPDWGAGDVTDRLARQLLERLSELPSLPAKVGFAIDAGRNPILAGDSADFRIERGLTGELIVRADGHATGTVAHSERGAVDLIIRLARWFMATGGADSGRMSRHSQPLPPWAQAQVAPSTPRRPLSLGDHALGAVYGLTFGQVEAAALRDAVGPEYVTGIRVTPWRRLLVEGAEVRPLPGLLDNDDAPQLRVDACPGAPHCEQATVATRELANSLSRHVAGRLHVSGCSKGCARRQPADVCVVGDSGRYQLIFQGRADGIADVTDLTESQVLTYFGVN
ncbi:precorrin-3B synthase [Marinobacter nanhaiticus D15-8W]|uniref:Cobalamin biosynthesis protein CobG n=1 Tax=Marinobacter nanhaiticus D15-8W TaxID=626887 RepID=N6W240_9GAMM|nr:precorrin-3B synthase [Marinobacter nanhaiticus]ENO14159.1 cobalamin biosynthesis protein CobG [Marinobacter nanhaiticus D15-8W]BES71543.1 precorrin-3B synthase [Marinobacter nanhaiticus D15-8W]